MVNHARWSRQRVKEDIRAPMMSLGSHLWGREACVESRSSRSKPRQFRGGWSFGLDVVGLTTADLLPNGRNQEDWVLKRVAGKRKELSQVFPAEIPEISLDVTRNKKLMITITYPEKRKGT